MSYWFGVAFQLAVVICAAYGIMFIGMIAFLVFKSKPGEPETTLCDHCGREMKNGEGVDCSCVVCQECLEACGARECEIE